MEGKGLIGICIQTLIWICILFIQNDKYEIYEFPDSFLIVILAIGLFIYFYELMWNSSINSILSKRIHKVNSKNELIKFLTQSKPFFEIISRAFHYSYEKKTVSFERELYFEFNDVKDYSFIKFMNIYSNEVALDNRIIVIDLNLLVKFEDSGCQEELDGVVQKIKNEDTFRDRYYDLKTKFAFRRLDEKENVFVFENQSFWFASKSWMIIFYILLVGEFYKIYFESLLYRCSVDLVKQINRPGQNSKIGKLLNCISQNTDKNEVYASEQYSANRQSSNASKSLSVSSNTKINRLTSNYIPEGAPLIDNYDPLFDVQPMAAPNYQTNSDILLSNDQFLEYTKVEEPQIFISQGVKNSQNISSAFQVQVQDKTWGMPFNPSINKKENNQKDKITASKTIKISRIDKEGIEEKNIQTPNSHRVAMNNTKIGLNKPLPVNEKKDEKVLTPRLLQNNRYNPVVEPETKMTSNENIKSIPKNESKDKEKTSSTEVSSSNTPTRSEKVYEKKITLKQAAAPLHSTDKKATAKLSSIIELSKNYNNSKIFNTSIGDSRISNRYEEDSNSEKDYSQEIRQEIFDLFDIPDQNTQNKNKIKKIQKVQKVQKAVAKK